MTQNRRPAKQIIQRKLQKQCDENKSLGGALRYKETNTRRNTKRGEGRGGGEKKLKNLSKQESHEKARQYLPALQMEVINSHAEAHPWRWGVCVCECVSTCVSALNQPFKNLARNKALLVIQLGQWAIDRDFHNSVRVAIRLAGERDHRSPRFWVTDGLSQPER